MKKLLKKLFLGLLSILGLSTFCWIILLMNPGSLYAHKTQWGKITVYHAQALQPNTKAVIEQAWAIIQKSDLFTKEIKLDICLNDGSSYPEYFPLKGGVAYSFLNKAVFYQSKIDFKAGIAAWEWEINDYQKRSWLLIELLAHEIVHVLQSKHDKLYPLKFDRWKIEGYAEYIARENKENISEEIQLLLSEKAKEHLGIPWIVFEDGTGVSLEYFEYRLLVRFLIEERNMTYQKILDSPISMQEARTQMLSWTKES